MHKINNNSSKTRQEVSEKPYLHWNNRINKKTVKFAKINGHGNSGVTKIFFKRKKGLYNNLKHLYYKVLA